MTFKTIWTLRGLPLQERFNMTKEWAAMTAAAHLPKTVKYWAFIQVSVDAIEPNDVVTEILFIDVLRKSDSGT